MKKWLHSLIKALIIFAAIIFLAAIHQSFSLTTSSASDSWVTFHITLLIFLLFGLLLGLEHLVCEAVKKGKWHVNLPRLILLGLPSLLFGFYFDLYYTNIPFLRLLAHFLPAFLAQFAVFEQLSILLLGYIVVTSFYRDT